MTMFHDINIDSKIIDDKIYVSVQDLANHLYFSALKFHEECNELKLLGKMDGYQALHDYGVATGMLTIVRFLAQGGVEFQIENQIHNVNDLLSMIDKKRSNDK